ncbi:MAG: hypothetical protein WDA27_03380 [Actinomycetota bacterium]
MSPIRKMLAVLAMATMLALSLGTADSYGQGKGSSAPKENAPNPNSNKANKRPNADSTKSTNGKSATANSGTIKVSAPQDAPDASNDPKPGCIFRVDFFGFRAGTLNLTITLQPPTGTQVIGTDSVTIASSSKGYQTSRTYDLTEVLSGFEAQDQQGYHVRVTTARDDRPGNGGKTKVIWLNCSPDADTTVRGSTFKALHSITLSPPGSEILGVTYVRLLANEIAGPDDVEVLGVTYRRSTSGGVLGAFAVSDSLARTGLGMGWLLIAGLLLLASGLLRVAGRKRPTR